MRRNVTPVHLYAGPRDCSLYLVYRAACLIAGVLGLLSGTVEAQELPPLPRGQSLPKPLPPLPQRSRSGQTQPRPVPPRRGGFREEARVERVVIDAHVTDDDGEPIRDLRATDFVVKVDGKRVPLESVEWVPAGASESPTPKLGEFVESETPTMPEPVLAYPQGRLIVLFYQTDLEPLRIHGFLRMAQYTDRFLQTLIATDRVAVVSFDSHLKLRQDFTDDRKKIRAAMLACLRKAEPVRIEPGPFPSLARNFDYAKALRAATPERGLDLVARALEPIPGGKSMLYFGWGLGTVGGITGPVPSERKEYYRALRSLSAARVNIFTLDITDADYHTLEYRLEAVSDATGGTYQKTHLFPQAALDRVTRAISGRYVLVFVKPNLQRGMHDVEVKLAGKRKGHVSARSYYED
ncbi:MAG TPA: VWA domain-containing protein [Thermoanaerobaculia bacterium]|nr:VWA domain-containing protein [Thermoanaerobaculia bacterium]